MKTQASENGRVSGGAHHGSSEWSTPAGVYTLSPGRPDPTHSSTRHGAEPPSSVSSSPWTMAVRTRACRSAAAPAAAAGPRRTPAACATPRAGSRRSSAGGCRWRAPRAAPTPRGWGGAPRTPLASRIWSRGTQLLGHTHVAIPSGGTSAFFSISHPHGWGQCAGVRACSPCLASLRRRCAFVRVCFLHVSAHQAECRDGRPGHP